MKKYIPHAILFLLAFTLGFFLGIHYIKKDIKVSYVQEKPITGEVQKDSINLITEAKPDKSELPTKTDTIYINNEITITEKVDTAAIIADYEKLRTYYTVLFDNEYGKLQLYPSIQYNQMQGLKYDFTPMQKVIYNEKKFMPFISGSYSTLGYFGIGGGLFYKRVGFEYQYQIGKERGHLVSVKWGL